MKSHDRDFIVFVYCRKSANKSWLLYHNLGIIWDFGMTFHINLGIKVSKDLTVNIGLGVYCNHSQVVHDVTKPRPLPLLCEGREKSV